MVKLTGILSQLAPSKVLVVGDLLLDSYTIGKVKRISPEAPVPILQVHHEEFRPGGAGNVMLNLVSLGANVTALGRVGHDIAGENLVKILQAENINVSGIVCHQGFPTPVKNRIIADNQQIVRLDHEKILPITEELEAKVIDSLSKLLEGIQVVAISDYGKGFLSKKILRTLIDLARNQKIPVVADPKGNDFAKYSGVTIIKPNLTEAYSAANLTFDSNLDYVAEKILAMTQSEALMLTRSEAGISLFLNDRTHQTFPVTVKEIKDVTGAGDTVLAMLTCALANGLSFAEAARLSNLGAGISIERFGCARVSIADLAQRLLEIDVVNKVFDEEHLFALQEVLKDKSFSLLSISSNQSLTPHIFSQIQLLAKKNQKLLIHMFGEENTAFINMLSSLHEVDFIIVNEDNLKNLCDIVKPTDAYEIINSKLELIMVS